MTDTPQSPTGLPVRFAPHIGAGAVLVCALALIGIGVQFQTREAPHGVLLIAMGGGLCGLSAVLFFMLDAVVNQPISRLADSLTRAVGAPNAQLWGTDRGDMLGHIARLHDAARDQAKESTNQRIEEASALVGDLLSVVRSQDEATHGLNLAANGAQNLVTTLNAAVNAVQATAQATHGKNTQAFEDATDRNTALFEKLTSVLEDLHNASQAMMARTDSLSEASAACSRSAEDAAVAAAQGHEAADRAIQAADNAQNAANALANAAANAQSQTEWATTQAGNLSNIAAQTGQALQSHVDHIAQRAERIELLGQTAENTLFTLNNLTDAATTARNELSAFSASQFDALNTVQDANRQIAETSQTHQNTLFGANQTIQSLVHDLTTATQTAAQTAANDARDIAAAREHARTLSNEHHDTLAALGERYAAAALSLENAASQADAFTPRLHDTLAQVSQVGTALEGQAGSLASAARALESNGEHRAEMLARTLQSLRGAAQNLDARCASIDTNVTGLRDALTAQNGSMSATLDDLRQELVLLSDTAPWSELNATFEDLANHITQNDGRAQNAMDDLRQELILLTEGRHLKDLQDAFEDIARHVTDGEMRSRNALDDVRQELVLLAENMHWTELGNRIDQLTARFDQSDTRSQTALDDMRQEIVLLADTPAATASQATALTGDLNAAIAGLGIQLTDVKTAISRLHDTVTTSQNNPPHPAPAPHNAQQTSMGEHTAVSRQLDQLDAQLEAWLSPLSRLDALANDISAIHAVMNATTPQGVAPQSTAMMAPPTDGSAQALTALQDQFAALRHDVATNTTVLRNIAQQSTLETQGRNVLMSELRAIHDSLTNLEAFIEVLHTPQNTNLQTSSAAGHTGLPNAASQAVLEQIDTLTDQAERLLARVEKQANALRAGASHDALAAQLAGTVESCRAQTNAFINIAAAIAEDLGRDSAQTGRHGAADTINTQLHALGYQGRVA